MISTGLSVLVSPCFMMIKHDILGYHIRETWRNRSQLVPSVPKDGLKGTPQNDTQNEKNRVYCS